MNNSKLWLLGLSILGLAILRLVVIHEFRITLFDLVLLVALSLYLIILSTRSTITDTDRKVQKFLDEAFEAIDLIPNYCNTYFDSSSYKTYVFDGGVMIKFETDDPEYQSIEVNYYGSTLMTIDVHLGHSLTITNNRHNKLEVNDAINLDMLNVAESTALQIMASAYSAHCKSIVKIN